jgi:hypothetical protein
MASTVRALMEEDVNHESCLKSSVKDDADSSPGGLRRRLSCHADRGSRRRSGRTQTGEKQKKNPNATGDPEGATQAGREEIDKTQPPAAIAINTDLVNVETVVYNKKTGGLILGLKKDNFEVYEDGSSRRSRTLPPQMRH